MIHIQWDTGYMSINPDKFFPCTLDTLKDLKKKVINISHNREEVIGQIRDHLRERVKNTDPESFVGKRLNRQLREVEQWE